MNFPEEYGMQGMSSVFFSTLIYFVLFIPLMVFACRRPCESPLKAVCDKHKFIGFIFGTVIAARLLSSTVTTVVKLELYTTTSIMPRISTLMFIFLLFSVITYGVVKCGGGKNGSAAPAGKAATLLCMAIAAVAIVMFVSLIQKMNLNFIYPSFDTGKKGYLNILFQKVGASSELFAYAVLLDRTKAKAHRSALLFLPLTFLFLEFILFMQLTTVGYYLNHVTYSFYMLASLSDIVLFRRLDGLDVVIWIVATVIKVVINMVCVIRVVKIVTGKQMPVVPVCAATAVAAAVFCFNKEKILPQEMSVPVLACLAVIAVILPIAAFMSKRKPPQTGEQTTVKLV